MNSYLALAITAIILIFLGVAAGIVATGLLVKETYEAMAAIYNLGVETSMYLKECWILVRSVGTF